MKIKVQEALKAMGMEKPFELAVFLGYTRQAGYTWGEYLPELACYRLLDEKPKLRRLLE